jgi:Ca2+-binding RTX toxin-like protein
MGMLAVLMLGLLLTGGVALAAVVNCPGGFNPCFGTAKADIIRGTNGGETIEGRGGADDIFANGGNDSVDGGPGDDEIHGGPGRDGLLGQDGNDALIGGPGPDTLRGRAGSDGINSDDVGTGGSRPEADVVDCGEDLSGQDVDTAVVDRLDTVSANCERVTVIQR